MVPFPSRFFLLAQAAGNTPAPALASSKSQVPRFELFLFLRTEGARIGCFCSPD